MQTSPVGDILREWRAYWGMSQLDLALEANLSARHISFIETGRSHASREMLLNLAKSLEMPLRERNSLLLAGGYAPRYGVSNLQENERLRQAVEMILRAQAPYPAHAVNAARDIVMGNATHERLLPLLLGNAHVPGGTVNAARLVMSPRLLRPRIRNWRQVAYSWASVCSDRCACRIRRRTPGPYSKR